MPTEDQCSPSDGKVNRRPRARDLGLTVGRLAVGPGNHIGDVVGVLVGHRPRVADLGDGRSVRTGVTVVIPHPGNVFRDKVPCAVHVINGFGKPTGFAEIEELGVLESPIALTNTLSVGQALHGLVEYALSQSAEIGVRTGTVNGVVLECNDSVLNDIRGLHVRWTDVIDAISAAVAGYSGEGAVGAGTGMVCYGWKGGIGTASRVVALGPGDPSYTVGCLVLANFGRARDLVVNGVPVGLAVVPPDHGASLASPVGSCVVILATDAPLDARQLGRLARRAQTGLGLSGGPPHHGSGEFVVAFSTGSRVDHWARGVSTKERVAWEGEALLDYLFQAVVECTAESVLNCLCAGETTHGNGGSVVHGFPVEAVCDLVTQRNGALRGDG